MKKIYIYFFKVSLINGTLSTLFFYLFKKYEEITTFLNHGFILFYKHPSLILNFLHSGIIKVELSIKSGKSRLMLWSVSKSSEDNIPRILK